MKVPPALPASPSLGGRSFNAVSVPKLKEAVFLFLPVCVEHRITTTTPPRGAHRTRPVKRGTIQHDYIRAIFGNLLARSLPRRKRDVRAIKLINILSIGRDVCDYVTSTNLASTIASALVRASRNSQYVVKSRTLRPLRSPRKS